MSEYRPQQQQISARVLTGSGWLEGTFHLPRANAFQEFLGHHSWYPLTNVVISRVGTVPFLELSRLETLLVSSPPLPVGPNIEELVPHKATLLFPGGAIDGTLELPSGLRLSDFVGRTTGFVAVRQANVRVWADTGAHFFDRLLVNAARLVAVTEPEVPA